nr:peptidoglycan editing factor PgeF [Gammaproteobacteria bacterium]
NLAAHVDDDPDLVAQNRQQLVTSLELPAEPQWLEQIHSTTVIDLDRTQTRQGDAAITARPATIAAVLTADCLPVLLCNRDGSEVGAAHAGWRGLVGGVVEQSVSAMRSEPAQLMAWLGPAIGPHNFEVGSEVREAFVRQHASAEACFQVNRPGHYLADLYALARLRLELLGIRQISGGEYCTYQDQQRFFSYRRDRHTGRQASLIYIRP